MKLRYGLALTDCYVLAASKIFGAKAVFSMRERGMKDRGLMEVLGREYDLVLSEDYA